MKELCKVCKNELILNIKENPKIVVIAGDIMGIINNFSLDAYCNKCGQKYKLNYKIKLNSIKKVKEVIR